MSDYTEEQLLSLEGETVENTNDDLDVERGTVESVEEDHLYGGELRAIITYPGHVGREGVLAEKLAAGETDWKVKSSE